MEKLIKHSTLASSFLIYIGFLKLKFLYDNFNINIIKYIDITEIISSFLNDLNIIFVVIIIFFFHYAIGMYVINKSIDKNRGKKTDYQTIFRYNYKLFNSQKGILIGLIISFPIATLSFLLFSMYSYNICIYTFVIFTLQTIILILESLKINELNEDLNLTGILSIVIVTGVLSYMLANNEYKKIIENDYSNTDIITTKEKISLSKNDIYIGKTKDYLFIKKNGKTTIINNSIIEKISFLK